MPEGQSGAVSQLAGVLVVVAALPKLLVVAVLPDLGGVAVLPGLVVVAVLPLAGVVAVWPVVDASTGEGDVWALHLSNVALWGARALAITVAWSPLAIENASA